MESNNIMSIKLINETDNRKYVRTIKQNAGF